MRDKLGSYCLALLLSAGALKANSLLAWMPFDLTALSAVLVSGFALWSRIRTGPASGLIALPVGIWVLLSLSIPAAVDTDYARTKLLTLFTVTLLLAVSPFYLLREPQQRAAFLRALVVIAGFGLISLLWGGADSDQVYGRLVLEGSDTIVTARVTVSGAIILFVTALLSHRHWSLRVIALAAAGALLATAFMTGSRGPAIFAVITLAAIAVFTPALRKFRIRAILSVLVVVSSVVVVLSREQNAGLGRILSFLSSESGGSRNVRSSLWQSAVEGIEQSPLGSGLGSYALHNDYGIEYPHNLLLEVGFELGWIPLLLLVALILIALHRGARNASTSVDVAFFGLLTFSLLGAMVSSDINGSRLLIVMVFATLTQLGTRKRAAAESHGNRGLPSERIMLPMHPVSVGDRSLKK